MQALWRRANWESYRSGKPQWRTILDVDALSKAEGNLQGYARRYALEYTHMSQKLMDNSAQALGPCGLKRDEAGGEGGDVARTTGGIEHLHQMRRPNPPFANSAPIKRTRARFHGDYSTQANWHDGNTSCAATVEDQRHRRARQVWS
ncbi:mll5816 [Mesorhizobium japonicum MAFF 303099]|uniref:Mll5816 protein n=1 Tax=Mesorhizobium japonicum (strain LMG 29417 / CECT 9101 / MAFF 303099) TaxID=266835 RepID=Q98AX4_RHILO|nr:mll5816 [Mesorhizobium japonicum MAFF 303099]